MPYRMLSVELTEIEEIVAGTLATGLHSIGMFFSLLCIARIWPPSRVLKLAYLTSLAASDFYSDVLYTFTQTFASRSLFAAAVFFSLAPTLAYMTATGLFWSFFSKMVPMSIKSAVGVWVIVFCGVKDLKVHGRSLPDGPWLWLVLVECSRILRHTVQQWREDFAVGGDDFLKVLFYFVKFVVMFSLGLLVLSIGLLGCAAMLVITPVVALAALVCGPLIGILWCLVHVNFKLSIFPGATAQFYKFMQHKPPDSASTRSLNLSFFTEIICESLPQFGVLLTNELLLASGQNRNPLDGFIATYTLASSALALLSNFWPFLVWGCRHGSISRALDEVLYVVTDDHAAQVRERNQNRKENVVVAASKIPESKVFAALSAKPKSAADDAPDTVQNI